MKSNQPTNPVLQKIEHYESMRELGAARFILVGAFVIFAAFSIWIGIYLPGGIILIFALWIMEHCSLIIIKKDSMYLIKKIGLFKPFLTVKRKSIREVSSLSIKTVSTRNHRMGQKERTAKIRYQLYFQLLNREIHIKTFFDKSEANRFAKDISQFLDIKIDKMQ
jgi:hypothetical protein